MHVSLHTHKTVVMGYDPRHILNDKYKLHSLYCTIPFSFKKISCLIRKEKDLKWHVVVDCEKP